MGARLLNRTTRKLSLTDEEQIAYERWRQIIEDLDEVEVTMVRAVGGRPVPLNSRSRCPLVSAMSCRSLMPI